MDFINWLEQEMSKRGWSVADLARASKISQSHLSRVLARERLIGTKAARSIARAFNLSEDFVLRKAGLLNPTWQQLAESDPSIGEIVEVVRQLPLAEREEMLRFALYRLGISRSDDSDDGNAKKPKR